MAVTPAPPWPDVEMVLITYLGEQTGQFVDTEHAEGTGIVVARVGGEDDRITDYPRVQLDFYGPDRDTVHRLSEQVRQLMLVLPGQVVELPDGGRAVIDSCVTDVPPEALPYDNPDRRRAAAFYQLGLRRPRGSR
ncbi:hypothetical protein GCM10027047_01660 [Rhodococcus aerolatus]